MKINEGEKLRRKLKLKIANWPIVSFLFHTPFFEGFLPQIFNINPTFDYHNVNNNIKERGSKIEEKTKFWFIELKEIHDQVNSQFNVTTTHNNDQFTMNFQICMKNFWDRIVLETDCISKFESKKRKYALNNEKGGSKVQKSS
ncbi:21823_t:CDS:2 [Entrophospora sp. SA101]|nr:21823_t:CDS:2 [Entrophospora sp. SA101]